jgi:histone acetyltransferase (RNA polymerase elongator complex component)
MKHQTIKHQTMKHQTMKHQTMKHQIEVSGGTWPTTNRDLIAKYLQAFVRFIKSIDFNKLQ